MLNRRGESRFFFFKPRVRSLGLILKVAGSQWRVFSMISFCFFLFKYLFIYLAALGLSCSMGDLRCGMWGLSLWYAGFSLVAAHRLSCPVACGILVPWPGIEPMSPALEGGFLTTGPPGKSQEQIFFRDIKRLCFGFSLIPLARIHHFVSSPPTK